MKAIIDNKLYDSETAELIFCYREKHPSNFCIKGYPLVNWHDMKFYKTKKGAYFVFDTTAGTMSITTEAYVRKTMEKLNPERYMKQFDVQIEEG